MKEVVVYKDLYEYIKDGDISYYKWSYPTSEHTDKDYIIKEVDIINDPDFQYQELDDIKGFDGWSKVNWGEIETSLIPTSEIYNAPSFYTICYVTENGIQSIGKIFRTYEQAEDYD